MSDTWCPQPWVGLSVRTVGDLRYCCNANSAEGRGVLFKEDGTPINLRESSISEGPNSQLLKDIRKSMVEGKRHPSCQRCYNEEDSGLLSRRSSEKLAWPDLTFEDIKKETAADGEIDLEKFPLKYLDLRFGNRCNLACRMCNPTESDQWYERQAKVWDVKSFKEGDTKLFFTVDENGKYGVLNNPYDWYANENFWKDFERILPGLRHIYFAGGEPLLIESHFDILEKCAQRGYAKNMTLEYNSNTIPITQRILDIWSNFKMVQMGASVDGVEEVNDYIRYPSKWDVVKKKMDMLDKSEAITKLRWTTTVQVYNFLHLPRMMMWILEQDYHKMNMAIRGREIMTPHPLHDPKFLSIKIFPEKSKKKIREIFEIEKARCKERIMDMDFTIKKIDGMKGHETVNERYCDRLTTILDTYCNVMDKGDYSDLIPKFWQYTNKLDEMNGTPFEKVCPQTAELLKL